jgi:maleylacetoacetate isomerase
MKLYHYWRSSSSWRVRWALELKKLKCEYVAVNLLSDEPEQPVYLARNPMGYVPALEVGGRYLSESAAIIEWLDETHPTPALLPRDPFERAHLRQLYELINSGVQPLHNLTTSLKHSSDPQEQKTWNAYWIERGLKAYETLVRESAGKFSFGDTVTMPDLFLIPLCYTAQRNEVDLTPYPTISRINANALATEECKRSAPEMFKPAT